MSQQLTLQFDGTLVEKFTKLRDVIALGVYQNTPSKVASLIDMAPSNLSAALAGDGRCLSVDQFERYIEKTGDVRPIHYLIARFIGMDEHQVAAARDARLEQLLTEANTLMRERASRKGSR